MNVVDVVTAADTLSSWLECEEDSESSDGSCVDVWEDPEALLDEGVELTSHAIIKRVRLCTYHATSLLLSLSPPSLSLQPLAATDIEEIVLCTRCAHALGKGEQQLVLSALDFESVSQVGSHASFPQWGSEGVCVLAG